MFGKHQGAPAKPACGRPVNVLLVAAAGLLAGWTATGGWGLIGHPLRHAILALALACAAVIAGWRQRGRGWLVLAVGLAVSLTLSLANAAIAGLCASVVLLAAVAAIQSGLRRDVLLVTAEALGVLAVYHFTRTSIPLVWHAADAVGQLLGQGVGVLTGFPLRVGPSFAGLDFLIVNIYVAIMAPLRWAGRGVPLTRVGKRIALASGCVLLAHGGYLAVLASSPSLLAELPAVQHALITDLYYRPAMTTWADVIRRTVPWNVPLLALAIHIALASFLLWLFSRRAPGDVPVNEGASALVAQPSPRVRALVAGACLICVAMVWSVAPSVRPNHLRGKKIVFYEKGFLNWLRPTHGEYGRYSIGMYGMLPSFLESYGATAVISPDLSADDLRGADVLVLFFPKEPWQAGQLDRIWQFVREGGALLVVGEHTVREADGGNRFNDVLAPTAMRVRFDSAMFAVGGWLQSYEPSWHATTAGISDNENDYGVVIGASLAARPPARPLVAGRWGWADPGDEHNQSAMLGNGRYDAGERLGDVVLAAEQSFGRGKIIAFGDTSSFSNGINLACHPFTSRLFAYLADHKAQPRSLWRDWIALALAAVLVIAMAAIPSPWMLAALALILGWGVTVGTAASYRASEVFSRSGAGGKLAYIDTSHLEAFSRESWREDGIGGLQLTLMRSGFLTLTLPELTAERLEGASLLISIAAARSFSRQERQVIQQFVARGGTFLCTVGGDRIGPSEKLLADLGIRVGAVRWSSGSPVGGFVPLGHFKTPYRQDGQSQAFVRFHAAWPVVSDDPAAQSVAVFPPNVPLIVVREIGLGRVVVIGDTCFAMNKNLEHEDGSPFEGLRENADFWRWFLPQIVQRSAAAAEPTASTAAPASIPQRSEP